ncbi:hypothetical protein RAZWK3B_20366 [Roseobacter sp. AzwK-3b]|uniref:DUF6497 family protein n=1 Tax=Roseobacter sp. AzwK-3b TaxID=351016 RepID=UPI0001569989|nr:DUF6497 family protein [Roseobacter sp. AzwK-3b]EDM71744.1 hypothetical protein RAZWK3B_20366 [Roseobacter sp. AzwK-3b]
MRPIGAHIPAMALVLAIASPATAQQDKAKEERLVLPSGLEAGLQEVISDQPGQGLTYRFRFVAPEFTGKEEFDSIMADLEYLCMSYAIPRLPAIGPQPRQVVISLADHPAEFGVFDPDVTQVFEAYRIEDGTCIWEEF